MKLSEMLRKSQLLLIIACGTYPILMLVLDSLAPQLLGVGWLYSAAYAGLALLGIRVKGKWRLHCGIAMSVVFTAVSVLLAPEGSVIGAGTAAVLCSGLLLWSLKLGGWSNTQEIAVLWIAAGVLSQLVGQIMVYVDRVDGGRGLAQYAHGILVSLFGFALLTMLSMNRNGLNVAAGKRQTVPGVMRQKNALLTIAMFLLAILAALLPSVLSGFSDVLKQMIQWLFRLIAMLIPDAEPEKVEDITGPAETPMQLGPGAETGLTLNPLVEKIALFVGSILSLLMLVFLLYQLFKFFRGGIVKIMDGLGKFASSVSEDYIDEVTDTRDELTPEKLERKKASSRLPVREPRNLLPAEKIRFRYRRLLRRHPEWDAGSTAREKLPENAAALYERARYSSHPVTEEDAERFSAGSKGI